jgi:hypothetical protein
VTVDEVVVAVHARHGVAVQVESRCPGGRWVPTSAALVAIVDLEGLRQGDAAFDLVTLAFGPTPPTARRWRVT